MIQILCDLCHAKINNVGQGPHFCAKCLPFMDEFLKRLTAFTNQKRAEIEKAAERIRVEYLKEIANERKS